MRRRLDSRTPLSTLSSSERARPRRNVKGCRLIHEIVYFFFFTFKCWLSCNVTLSFPTEEEGGGTTQREEAEEDAPLSSPDVSLDTIASFSIFERVGSRSNTASVVMLWPHFCSVINTIATNTGTFNEKGAEEGGETSMSTSDKRGRKDSLLFGCWYAYESFSLSHPSFMPFTTSTMMAGSGMDAAKKGAGQIEPDKMKTEFGLSPSLVSEEVDRVLSCNIEVTLYKNEGAK
mmetsp:Transcript_4555/g.9425  ORF Transcript_4555/g.9425 Transcript_4555/m.9425 type:complete len:232 (-) Transcript_4555:1729-2424(-)